MTLMDRLAAGHNRLSDLAIVWWPFGFLKPPPDQPITIGRAVLMAPCFSSFFLLAYLTRNVMFDHHVALDHILVVYGQFCFGFLLWFNFVTRPLWNRRARAILSISEKVRDSDS